MELLHGALDLLILRRLIFGRNTGRASRALSNNIR